MRHRWSKERHAWAGRTCTKCGFTERTVRFLRSIGHKHRCTGRESLNLA